MPARLQLFLASQISIASRCGASHTVLCTDGELKSVERRYAKYTSIVLRDLTRDIADPSQYLSKQFLRRLALQILSEVWCKTSGTAMP